MSKVKCTETYRVPLSLTVNSVPGLYAQKPNLGKIGKKLDARLSLREENDLSRG
jgi:hypothetical protein